MKKKLGIIGAGWLGTRIADVLQDQYTIYTTTSSVEKLEDLSDRSLHPTLIHFPNEITPIQPWKLVNELDAIVCTVHIADRKSSAEEIKNRIANLASFLDNFKGTIIFTSSTGVYPSIEKDYQEEDLPIEQVPGEAMVRTLFPQAIILRLAGLMGDDRLLKKYTITQLEQPVNHIHYTDIARLIAFLLKEHPQPEVYNVVAPLHPSKSAVIASQNQTPLPEETTVTGRIMHAFKLAKLSFTFQFPDPRYFHIKHSS
jgi:nucleoside-diphosphate-sugar epimerase